MADYYSPATNIYPHGKWTLAGANSDGIVYGVSIDETILQVILWSYNNFRLSWKILAVSDLPAPPRQIGSYYLTSAVYDERLERVDIFVECNTSSYTLRFITEPEPKFDSIFSTINDENVEFDGYTGPSLNYCCGRLIVTGSKRGDDGEVFRIFQVLINEEERSFRLVPGWTSDGIITQPDNHVVAFGNRLLVLTTQREVFCFTPDTREGILRWPNPTLFRHPLSLEKDIYDDVAALCPSLNSPDVIWIVSRNYGIRESTVTPDGVMDTRRTLDWEESPDELGAYTLTNMTKSAAASTSHIFWLQDEVLEISSKSFGVPALEYLCLSKLRSTMEEFRRCESEKDAILMGIPVTTWRRYCR